MNLITYIFSAMIINAVEIYSYYKIPKEKINLKSPKLYLIYILQTVLIILNYTFVSNLIKVIFTFLIMILICKLLFIDKKISYCIGIAIISEMVVIFSEFLFMMFMGLLLKVDNSLLIKVFEGKLGSNLVIVTLSYLVLKTKIPTMLHYKMHGVTDEISRNKLIVLFTFVIFCASTLFYISYYNENHFLTLVFNFSVTTIYFMIVILILIKERNYNIINSKYLTTLNQLEEYENLINEYRIINHENKNELLCIKGLTNNKKVNEYINEILESRNTENEKILKQALLIPTGGLRGLIYSKLLLMKNNDIKYNLNIDKYISSKLMKDIPTKTMIDICQIVGVFLDNAIEALKEIENKNIVINIYFDNNLNIEIINNITNQFNINKIDKAGYTTKGHNHGYGLVLVNRILKENKNLINEREISKSRFKQKLIIKI